MLTNFFNGLCYMRSLIFRIRKHNLLFVLVLVSLSSHSCDDDISAVKLSSSEDYLEIPITDSICDSFTEERETVDIYEDELGEIQLLELNEDVIRIVIAPERISRFMYSGVVQPCNLPDTLINTLNKSRKIVFSGSLKEVFPTENMVGNPFKLTALKIRIVKDDPVR